MAEIQVRVKNADDVPGPLGGPPIVHGTSSQTLQVSDDYLFLQGSTLGNTQFQELQRMPVGDRGLAIVGGRVTIQEGAVSRNPWTGNRIGTSGAQEALNDYKILMRRHNVPANMQSQRAMHDFSLYNRAHGVQRPRINVHSADAQARQEYTAGSEEIFGALLGGVGFKVGSVAIKGVGKGIAWLAAKEAARRAAIEKGVEWTAGAGFTGMFGYHTAVSGGKNITDPWVGKVSNQAGLFSTLSGGMYPGPDIPLSSGLATGANRFMGMVAPFAIAMMGKQGWKEFRNRGKPTDNTMAENPDPRLEGGDHPQTKAATVKAFGTQKIDVSWLMKFKHTSERNNPAHPFGSGTWWHRTSELGVVFYDKFKATVGAGIHEIFHAVQSMVSPREGHGDIKYFENFSREFKDKYPELANPIETKYQTTPYRLGKEYQAWIFSEWLIAQTGIRGLAEMAPSIFPSGRRAIQANQLDRHGKIGLSDFVTKKIKELFEIADEYGFGYLEGKDLAQLRVLQSKIQDKINYYEKNGYETSALEKRLAEVKDYIENGTLPPGERAAKYPGFEENLGEGVFSGENNPENVTPGRGPTVQRPAARRELATALGDLGIGIRTPEGPVRSLVREGAFTDAQQQKIKNVFQSVMDNQSVVVKPSRKAGMRVIELSEQYKKAIKEGKFEEAEAIRVEALRIIQETNGLTFGLMEEPGPLMPPAVTVPPTLGGTGTTGRQPEPAPAPVTPEPKPRPDIKPFVPDPDFVPEVIPPEVKPPEVVPEVIPPEVKPPEVVPEIKPPEVVPEVKPPKPAPAPEVIPEVPIVPVPDAPGVPPRPEIIAGVPRPGPKIQPGRVPLPVPALPIPLVPGPKPKQTTPTVIDFPGFDKSAGFWLPVAPSFHSGQWAYPGYIIDSGRLDYNVD